jgi:phosphate:Na+ symporter
MLARGSVTLFLLAVLLSGYLNLGLLGRDPGTQGVMLHIALNALALALGLPAVGALTRLAERIVPRRPEDAAAAVSALDPAALGQPPLALACAQRELQHMGETVQAMLTPVMGLFRKWDPATAELIERREDEVDRMHYQIKIYLSQLRESDLTQVQSRRAVELVAMANSLEEAADRIATNLLALAGKLRDEGISFSAQGLADIEQFHDHVVTNAQLSLGVLTTGDVEAARQLVAEKDLVRREEQTLQERHLARLQHGEKASVISTNIHQETLRTLKQVNAAISYVAYPIAEETGELLQSRLARPASAGGPG